MTELDRLVAAYLDGEQAQLTDIKTLWQNTTPRPEGTWKQFCLVRLGKSHRQVNRLIEGKTGNEARNVNDGSSNDPSLQDEENWESQPEIQAVKVAIYALSTAQREYVWKHLIPDLKSFLRSA